VAAVSGNSVRVSPITSSFTSCVSSSSRASRAVVTASCTVVHPAVLGRMWKRSGGIQSSREPRSREATSTRRTATVTISAPLASSALRFSSNERYLPVPMISRERSSSSPSR